MEMSWHDDPNFLPFKCLSATLLVCYNHTRCKDQQGMLRKSLRQHDSKKYRMCVDYITGVQQAVWFGKQVNGCFLVKHMNYLTDVGE